MIRLTSLGVMVLNSPGAVSLPVIAPSSYFSDSVEVLYQVGKTFRVLKGPSYSTGRGNPIADLGNQRREKMG
jgi:hypothetical protein